MSNGENPFDDMDFSFDPDDESLVPIEQDEEKLIGAPEVIEEYDIKDITELSEEELESVEIIKTYERGAANRFAYQFLRDVKDEFELHGAAYKHYVLEFRVSSGMKEIELFKRNLTVRISDIRKQASKVRKLDKFWVTFIRIVPVNARVDGLAQHWFITLARMNEVHYRHQCKQRALSQTNRGESAELMEKSIGVL